MPDCHNSAHCNTQTRATFWHWELILPETGPQSCVDPLLRSDNKNIVNIHKNKQYDSMREYGYVPHSSAGMILRIKNIAQLI